MEQLRGTLLWSYSYAMFTDSKFLAEAIRAEAR